MALPEIKDFNIGTNILAAYRGGQQRARGERFNALAGQALSADPSQRDALVSQAVALDPQAGFELSKQLESDTDRRRTTLYNMARGFKQIHSQNPQAAAGFYQQQIAPGLQRLGFQVSDVYNEAEVLPVVEQVLAAFGGAGTGDAKVVGGSLVDPTGRVIYQAPQRFQTDSGLIEIGQDGVAREVTLGGPTPQAQPPEVENLEGVRGRYSIGADGRPVFIASGLPAEVAAGIPAAEGQIATQDQVTLPAPGQRILPRGAGADAERLRLAQEANARAAEAAERAREAAARASEIADIERRLGKTPPGFRVNAAGTAFEPSPGAPKPAGSAATTDERKAATLLKRLEFSEQQLEKAVQESASAASPNLRAEIVRGVPLVGGVVANTLTPQARQRVEAAQLDILDAALTLGTGAAYTREQLEGYRSSYFPQIGDDQATIDDKAARLQNVIDAARIAAGRAAPQADGSGGGPAAPAPQRARNPQTGQVIELRNGQWVPVDG